MSSLLDEAIKVGKELEGSEGRLAALKASIDQAEGALKARQQELAQVERDVAQRVKAAQATWAQQRRDQADTLTKREADVATAEAALKTFPAQAQALADRERACDKRESEANTQWQKAKQAELDWQERNKELDEKAAAINRLKA